MDLTGAQVDRVRERTVIPCGGIVRLRAGQDRHRSEAAITG